MLEAGPAGVAQPRPRLTAWRSPLAGGIPIVREYADPHVLVDLAVAAEAAGWDGVYLWDHIAREEDPAHRRPPTRGSRSRRSPCDGARAARADGHAARAAAALEGGARDRRARRPLGRPLHPRRRARRRDAQRVRRVRGGDGRRAAGPTCSTRRLAVPARCGSARPSYLEGERLAVHGAAVPPRPVQAPRIPVCGRGPLAEHAPLPPRRALGRRVPGLRRRATARRAARPRRSPSASPTRSRTARATGRSTSRSRRRREPGDARARRAYEAAGVTWRDEALSWSRGPLG